MATSDTFTGSNSGSTSDYRWLIIVAFYSAAAIFGLIQALSENGLAHLLSSLLLACSAAGWCAADALRRGKSMPWAVKLLTFLFWPIAAPIYLIVSRGWRGVGWTLLNVLCIYAVVFAAYIATWYLLGDAAEF